MKRLGNDNPDQVEIDYYIDEISPFWQGSLDTLRHMPLNKLKSIYMNKEKRKDFQQYMLYRLEQEKKEPIETEDNKDYDFEEDEIYVK